MSQCLSRITYESEKLPFGDGKHYFYLELQCDRISDEALCNKCCLKRKTNVQESRFFDHGSVNGPYTENSHIFDTPWYIKSVKAYGTPTHEVLEKAMEAQSKARGKGGSVKVVRKPASPKTVIVDTGIMILPLNKMVESNDEPLEVDSVVKVTLKSLVVNEVKYWLDSDSGKVYNRLSTGGKGNYVGHWNGEAISEVADSDDD